MGRKDIIGFDCSGLVQSVLNVYGIKYKRFKNQWKFLEPYKINMDKAKGDLHFFGKKVK